MRKQIATIAGLLLFSTAALAQSQGNNGGQGNSTGNCAAQRIADLQTCLLSKGVTFTLVPSMATNQVYLFVSGDPAPGRVTSCMQQYTQGNNSCGNVPALIEADMFEF